MNGATILTIGDELLIGQVVDTNSAWMAQELNKAGIWVNRRVSVGDNWDEIWKALDEEASHTDLILITGGLGPTEDDITKTLLCEYFGGKMVVNEEALANVRHIFEKVLQRPIIERNLRQAEVPDNCKVIQNKRGTAPGMWFEKNNRIFISMPGVPFEMKGMMTDDIIPLIRQRLKSDAIAHRVLLLAGIGESFLEEHIKSFEDTLPEQIKLAFLPNYGLLRLRLTGISDSVTQLESTLDQQFGELKKLVSDWMVADEDISLQEMVGRMLTTKQKSLGTAESCTGGYIAHLITSVPGSSNYFKGSVISYANEVKENLLGVSHETISHDGAVSEATVKQMVEGALEQLGSDYAIATSGIMGPSGGSQDKPVGTAWIATGDKQRVVAQKFFFRFDRLRNIELAANAALNQLRKFVLGEIQ